MSQDNNVAGMIAGIASFLLPGLGQLLQGRLAEGVGFFLAFCISIVLLFVLIGFILLPVVYIWSIYDAVTYKSTS